MSENVPKLPEKREFWEKVLLRIVIRYGAFHAAEVPFVFGDLSAFNMLSRPEDEVFSDLMMTIWTNFAKTGNPSVVGGVFIGRFTTLKMQLKLFLGRIFSLNPAYAANE